MLQIGKTLVSEDLLDRDFVCNITQCKGACCVEGDAGAPLEDEETKILEEIYPIVKDYITEEGRTVIESQGTWVIDKDGDKGTPTLGDNRECAYAVFTDNGTAQCGIENAQKDGKLDWKKPISCHLYPIRIQEFSEFTAINYHKIHIHFLISI